MKNVTILDGDALGALQKINHNTNVASKFSQAISTETLKASNSPDLKLKRDVRERLQRKALVWAELTTLLSQVTTKIGQIFIDEGRLLESASFSLTSTEPQPSTDEKQAELPIQEAAEKEGDQ